MIDPSELSGPLATLIVRVFERQNLIGNREIVFEVHSRQSDTQQAAQGSQQAAQGSQQIAQGSQQIAPEAHQTAQEAHQTAPEAHQTAQEAHQTSQEAHQTAQESQQAAQESQQAAEAMNEASIEHQPSTSRSVIQGRKTKRSTVRKIDNVKAAVEHLRAMSAEEREIYRRNCPGQLTQNGFLNFLREIRPICKIPRPALTKEGGIIWKTMSKKEKARYNQDALNIQKRNKIIKKMCNSRK